MYCREGGTLVLTYSNLLNIGGGSPCIVNCNKWSKLYSKWFLVFFGREIYILIQLGWNYQISKRFIKP